jgi:hypothetical protein
MAAALIASYAGPRSRSRGMRPRLEMIPGNPTAGSHFAALAATRSRGSANRGSLATDHEPMAEQEPIVKAGRKVDHFRRLKSDPPQMG